MTKGGSRVNKTKQSTHGGIIEGVRKVSKQEQAEERRSLQKHYRLPVQNVRAMSEPETAQEQKRMEGESNLPRQAAKVH